MAYPIIIKCGRNFLESLIGCESGREDAANNARGRGDLTDVESNDYQCVFNDFSTRRKQSIRIHNDAELAETYYVLASGTITEFFPDTAARLAAPLKEEALRLNPELAIFG